MRALLCCTAAARLFQPLLRGPAARAAVSVPPALAVTVVAVPTAAVADGGIVDAAANFGLSIVIFGFVAFIAYCAFQAVSVIGSQSGDIGKVLRDNTQAAGKDDFFDDGGSSFTNNRSDQKQQEQLQRELANRKKKKQSKQVGVDGTRLAPWMTIDEDRIDKIRSDRKENKRKTGKFFG